MLIVHRWASDTGGRTNSLLHELRQRYGVLLVRHVVHLLVVVVLRLLGTRRRRVCLRWRSDGGHAGVDTKRLPTLVLVGRDGRCEHAERDLLVADFVAVRCLRREQLVAVVAGLLASVDFGLRRVHWALLLLLLLLCKCGLAGQEHLDGRRYR